MYKDSYGGEYYINIDKHNPDNKYQFHFESGQFMDKHDNPIKLSVFMEDSSLRSFYDPIVAKALDRLIEEENLDNSMNMEISSDTLMQYLSDNRDFNQDFIEALYNGDLIDVWNFYESDFSQSDIEMYYLDELDDNAKSILEKNGLDLSDTDS
jgi:hypothetical protein